MKELSFPGNLSTAIDFASSLGKELSLQGQVQNIRALAWGGFLILRLPGYTVQCVADASVIDLSAIAPESCVRVSGIVKEASIKDKALWPRDFELQLTRVELVSAPSLEALPVDTTKKELACDLSTKFDLRPLTLRHPKQRAIFGVQATIFEEFGAFLTRNGFTRICSPKIVFSGAEGGANIFEIGYFDRKAYLAQSPQFYKQMMVGVFGRVFEEAPVFRAEKHDTSRHLNEYISLDLEMALQEGFEELITMEASLLNAVFAALREKRAYEAELLGMEIPSIDRILCVKFSEVHEIVLKETGKDFRAEKDLEPEEERLICEYAKREWGSEFVFVTHYPTSKRPFYAAHDPANPEESLSFDLLFRGIEITTGGQRLHKIEDYEAKMRRLGMGIEQFESYLQAFRYGMPPHGGLGLGLERLTAQLCGLANVKEASLFPRDLHRLTP
jgi:nondiscriminating aspartyl-tRNA synthetase